MKFNKFLKEVGTHGEVIKVNESEQWLVCENVGMIIPKGVKNLLGRETTQDNSSIINALRNAELDDSLELVDAKLLDPTGNASSIYRIFESELGERVAIINSNYGLLEKSDNLGYGELIIPSKEGDEDNVVKFVLVFDASGKTLQGFIKESDLF